MAGFESLPAWLRTFLVLGAIALLIFAGRYLLRPFIPLHRRDAVAGDVHGGTLLLVVGIVFAHAIGRPLPCPRHFSRRRPAGRERVPCAA